MKQLLISCILPFFVYIAPACVREPPENLEPSFRFAEGRRLLSQGAPIDVVSGHASPYIFDFDGDGVDDLLVGEFGDGKFTGETTAENSDKSPLANARLRVYRNTGSNKKPAYDDGFDYLQAGGENASVPNT